MTSKTYEAQMKQNNSTDSVVDLLYPTQFAMRVAPPKPHGAQMCVASPPVEASLDWKTITKMADTLNIKFLPYGKGSEDIGKHLNQNIRGVSKMRFLKMFELAAPHCQKGNGKGGYPQLLDFNSTKQPDRAYAPINEAKRFPG